MLRPRTESAAAKSGRPLVVTRLVKSALRIVAMNDAAERFGLRPGMPLADARAMYPALAVAESDEAAERRLLDAVAEWCDRYTPLVGLDLPDGLMLDITGCAHLFGGEAALARDLLGRLSAQGLAARIGIADTAGCAVAVARYGGACVVPSRQLREALSPLPMAALRVTAETAAALAELGLKRIGDIIDLPRAPLAARFGEILIRRLDQALGRLDEPITPRLPVPSYVAEQQFPHPIGLERDVLGTIGRLAARLGEAMERRQEGARLLTVALFRADNKVYRIEAGTGAPVRDAGRIVRLFADRLAMIGEACDPGFGYDMVRLAALIAEPSMPEQTCFGLEPPRLHGGRGTDVAAPARSTQNLVQEGLVQEGLAQDSLARKGLPGLAEPAIGYARSGYAACDDVEFSHLLDRLGARFGLHRVIRLLPQDTHIPEFAVIAVPWAADRGRTGRPAFPSSAGRPAAFDIDGFGPGSLRLGPHWLRQPWSDPADSPVRPAGAGRGACRNSRRSAGALSLAARSARSDGRGGPRTHRHGMVA